MKLSIQTNNFILYEKLNELKHSSFVKINKKEVEEQYLFRIVNNLNKMQNNIKVNDDENNLLLIKNNSKLDFNLYYKKKI